MSKSMDVFYFLVNSHAILSKTRIATSRVLKCQTPPQRQTERRQTN